MCSILLSINPIHVENIMNGTKLYEFRKKACKQHVDRIVIYSTTPIKKVVGEAEVEDVLIDNPQIIWNITHEYSGINKTFFDRYYNNSEQAADGRGQFADGEFPSGKYQEPKDLKSYGINNAPQSFQYI